MFWNRIVPTRKPMCSQWMRMQVELNQPNVLGTSVPVGENPLEIIVTEDGKRLYVSYDGDGATDPGAVAVVEITEDSCADIFKEILEPCPNCAERKLPDSGHGQKLCVFRGDC